ncbi:MAG: hypothetical protein JW833_00640 [Prolixibacteraceae bacterium]|nr:hypothetical protein [Prolixibacteraceae bacterium]
MRPLKFFLLILTVFIFAVSCQKDEIIYEEDALLLSENCLDIEDSHSALKHALLGVTVDEHSHDCGVITGYTISTSNGDLQPAVDDWLAGWDSIEFTYVSPDAGMTFKARGAVNITANSIFPSDYSSTGLFPIITTVTNRDIDQNVNFKFKIHYEGPPVADWHVSEEFSANVNWDAPECYDVGWTLWNYTPCVGYMLIKEGSTVLVDTRTDGTQGTISVEAGTTLSAFLYGVNCGGVAIAGSINVNDTDGNVDGSVQITDETYSINGNIWNL